MFACFVILYAWPVSCVYTFSLWFLLLDLSVEFVVAAPLCPKRSFSFHPRITLTGMLPLVCVVCVYVCVCMCVCVSLCWCGLSVRRFHFCCFMSRWTLSTNRNHFFEIVSRLGSIYSKMPANLRAIGLRFEITIKSAAVATYVHLVCVVCLSVAVLLVRLVCSLVPQCIRYFCTALLKSPP